MSRDASIRSSISLSHLASLPTAVLESLSASSRLRGLPAGTIVHGAGPVESHFTLVVSGLVRVYVSAPDGRSLTVRYCRAGSLLGALTIFGAKQLPASIQSLVETRLLEFDPAVVRDLSERDARVSRVLVEELSERVYAFIAEIPGSAFSSVRERVARHLLDLASDDQSNNGLVATVGQQGLADAVGTSREVVVRALRELREARLIETGRGLIRLLDPERLVAEWNKSS